MRPRPRGVACRAGGTKVVGPGGWLGGRREGGRGGRDREWPTMIAESDGHRQRRRNVRLDPSNYGRTVDETPLKNPVESPVQKVNEL